MTIEVRGPFLGDRTELAESLAAAIRRHVGNDIASIRRKGMMKATTQHTLFCECNHSLSYVASAAGTLNVVQCANVRCQHYGKRFEAPTFELAEIPLPAPPQTEVVEIGEGNVAAVTAEELVGAENLASDDPAP